MSVEELGEEIKYRRSLDLERHHDIADHLAEMRRIKRSVVKGFRLKTTSPKEREHKLYEDARQRDDYEENKDKNRSQLAEAARESSGSAKDKAKIRAQADAAKQVGDREHVRPGVKG